MVEKVNLYSTTALERVHAFHAQFHSLGSSAAVACRQALSLVDKTMQGQAAMLGFENLFRATAIVVVAAIPLLLLFRKGRPIPSRTLRLSDGEDGRSG